jgi:pimeloyl-ACP methyl ester carboxylesterase
MPSYWIAVIVGGIVIAIVLGIKIYWTILLAFFPARERASEVHTVVTKDMWEIKLFRYRRGRSNGEPVLLVHGACANHKNFTEPEGACIVDELVARGFDCWAIDLRVCQSSKPAFERAHSQATYDDSLLYDLPAAIRYIRKNTSYGRVHWIGHSMGGMLLYAYAQYWGSAHIASGTTLGSPIGFDGASLKLKRVPSFARQNPRGMANILRALIPIMYVLGLRSSLFPLNPKNLHKRIGPGSLFHMIEDPVPNAVDALLEWARTKKWLMLGGKLDVKAGLNTLDLPLFTLFAPRDAFVPVEHARRFFNALPAPDKKFALLSREEGCQHDYDHCDLAFGADAPRMVFEPIAKWIEAHPIAERVRAEAIESDDEPVRKTLGVEQRAEILSGESFAHLQAKSGAPAPADVAEKAVEAAPDATVAPVETPRIAIEIERIPEAAPPRKKPAAKAKPAPAKNTAKAAPAKKAAARQSEPAKPAPAAKSKPAPEPATKPAARPVAKAPEAPKKAAAKKPVAPVKTKAVPAKAKAAPAKPAPAPAKPKAAPAKPKAAPAKAKAAPTKAKAPAAPDRGQKSRPSLLTKSAILSASEALRDLEKKK